MITSLGSQWTTADLTGNGTFVELAGGESSATYVVSNTLLDGSFKIYKSEDAGLTFDVVANGVATGPFEPVVDVSSGVIHIVGASGTSLVAYIYNTADDDPLNPVTLTPHTLVSGARIHTGYDMVLLGDGSHIVCVGVTESVTPAIPGYALIALHIDSSLTVTSTDVISAVSDIRSGEVYGGLSMVSTDGVHVELYYTAHAKRITFGSIEQSIRVRTYDSGAGSPEWSDETSLLRYTCPYIDDKLTVLPLSTGSADRILTHLYYTQSHGKLATVMKLGSRVSGDWVWMDYQGSETRTYMEPTLSVNTDGDVFLAYLAGDVNLKTEGILRVTALDPATLRFVQQYGNYNQMQFKWLRGSKSPTASTNSWCFIGERAVTSSGVVTGYEPIYISNLNLPPTVVLNTTSATLARGVLLHLDASLTHDPDLDAIEFTWATDDPTGLVELIPIEGSPSMLDVLVPKAIGPDQHIFHVTVTAQDVNYLGLPINAGQVGTVTITVPVNARPSISWDPVSPITVTRNSVIVLEPIITDAESDALTYEWTQLTGHTLAQLTDANLAYLTVATHGVNVLGETVSFRITVSDGIGAPVSSDVSLVIPSINMDNLDSKFLCRAVHRSGAASPIASRNNPDGVAAWSTFQTSAVSTEFFKIRNNRTVTGKRRQLYIAPRSCTVLGIDNDQPGEYFYRRMYLPGNDRGLIVDAVHTESDQTIVLTDEYKLTRYDTTDLGDMNLSDFWQSSISILAYLRGGTVKWFTCAPPIGGRRVAAFVTDKGLLLVQIREADFRLEAVLFLSVYEFNLYGGDDILFVRFQGVENLRRGKILVGSRAPKASRIVGTDTIGALGFDYFETLFDLDLRSVVDIWDKINRINERVVTGELIEVTSANYAGILQPPLLSLADSEQTSAALTWEMVRSDLASQYNIYAEKVPGRPGTSVNSAPVIDGFKCMETEVAYGYPATLRWDVSGADHILIDDAEVRSDLSHKIVTPTATTSYVLKALNHWGESQKIATVLVSSAAPTINFFTINGEPGPVSINLGDTVTLAWDVLGGDTLTLDQGLGAVTGRKSKSFQPLLSGTYTLYAANPFGDAFASVDVVVL